MINFIKSALVNGLVILLPVVLVFLAIKEILAMLVGIATPIADLFPEGTFDHIKETEIIAVLLIAGLAIFLGVFIAGCFLTGWRLGSGKLSWTKRSVELLGSMAIVGFTFTLGVIYSTGSGNWPALLLIDLFIIRCCND